MKGKAPRTKGAQEPPPGYNESAIVIYETPGGVRVDVNLGKETVLLNLNQMSILFDRDKSVISSHLRKDALRQTRCQSRRPDRLGSPARISGDPR